MSNFSIPLGTSLLALIAGQAHAQAVDPAAGKAKAPASATAPANGSGLADIVVTASKVQSLAQRTPAALSTFTGKELSTQGIATVQDLSKLVPGLLIESNGPFSSVFLRGVGTRVLSPTNDSAIAFSVDGVYFARPLGTSATLFDVGRIEVVKGPQGTLYGRNATGGAVNVVTNRPDPRARTVEGEVEVGNYGAIRTMAAANFPLNDSAALRIAAQQTYNHGYMSDHTNDTNIKAIRGSFLANLTPGVKLFLSADYSTQGGKGIGAIPVGPSGNNNALTTRFVVPDDPYVGPSDPRINAALARAMPVQTIPGPGPGVFCRGLPLGPIPPSGVAGVPARLLCTQLYGANPVVDDTYNRNRFWGLNATLEADVGIGDLTAIAGYRHNKLRTRLRIDYGTQDNATDGQHYSGELRLASKPNDGPLKWLVGGFFLHEDQHADGTIDNSPQAIGIPGTVCVAPIAPGVNSPCIARVIRVLSLFKVSEPENSNENYAVFGQATLTPVHGFRLTGGIRYTHEHKQSLNGFVTQVYSLPVLTTTYPSGGKVDFRDTSYKVAGEIDLAPRSMLYANYSTAFHAGGFNAGVEAGPNPYIIKPEKVKSWVVGIKNRLFDNRLQLNVEAYRLNYLDYQQGGFGYINDGSFTCSTLLIRPTCPLSLRYDNAAKARVQGVETDVLLKVGSGGLFNANILYNDAKFLQFDVINPFTNAQTSYAGGRLPGANTWTVSAGYTQVFRLANGGSISASLHSQYKNGSYTFYTAQPASYQPAFTRTDFTLGYEEPGRHWSVSAFVRNIEDKAVLLQGGPINAASGFTYSVLAPPRTFGAKLRFAFGKEE